MGLDLPNFQLRKNGGPTTESATLVTGSAGVSGRQCFGVLRLLLEPVSEDEIRGTRLVISDV